MMRARLDVEALLGALEQQRKSRELSWRQVAGEAGISPSTISRMRQGKRPDVDSFAALVRWLGIPADPFLKGGDDRVIGAGRETLAILSTHLRADKNLSPETVDALQDLLGVVERFMKSSEVPKRSNGRT